MNFNEFINKNWDRSFCRRLALEAQYEYSKILNEMSMAGGQAPKMPILPDEDDYKFLQQFPTELWTKALSWRYNDGMREMLSHAKNPRDIPEGWDYVEELTLPSPNRDDIKWIFGKKGAGKNIYIGLTKLVRKLSDPPKEHSKHKGEDKAYWAGEGPAIGDIDPNQTDKNHPSHISKYKHGLYNYDLSGGVNISPEDIDDMSPYEMMPRLKQEFQHMLLPGQKPEDNAAIMAEIKKKKAAMKKSLKHTFSGFNVLQKKRASQVIGNWVRVNGAPEKLLGDYPKKVFDPSTGKEHDVKELTDPSQIADLVHGRWGKQVALNLGREKQIPIKVPVYQKKFNFRVLKKGQEHPMPADVKEWIPVLNPAKALPQITLTPEQKEAVAKFRKKNPDAEEDDGDVDENGEKVVKSAGTLQGLLNIWDLLTPEQKEEIKSGTRTLFQVAQAKWNAEPGAKRDMLAHPGKIYAIGHSPNKEGPERGSFSIPEEKTKEFIDKYYKKIYPEVLGAGSDEEDNDKENGGGFVDKNGEKQGKLDRIFHWMKESGKYPDEVITALKARQNDIAEFATYMLLGHLDDPRYGIYDPEIGLLKDFHPSDIDEKANRMRRDYLVNKFVASIAQIPLTGNILSRRRREKYGQVSTVSSDSPTGDSGESGAGNISGHGKKGPDIKLDPVRSWHLSQQDAIVRASTKTHKMLETMHKFLATRRNYIINRLNNSPEAAKDLTNAENKIATATAIAAGLYAKYEDELSSKYKKEDELDKAVMAKVNAELPAALSKAVGEVSPEEKENILAQIKGMGSAGLHAANASIEQAKKVFNKFWSDFINHYKARFPKYNPVDDTFTHTHEEYPLEKLGANDPNGLIEFMKSAYYAASFPELAPEAMKNFGPKLYATLQAQFEDFDTDEEQAAKVAADEKKFLDALALKSAQAAPAQAPQQAAQAAPQMNLAAPQMNLAAKPLHDLLATAPMAKNRAEFAQVINTILSRKNEFLNNPSEAAKLRGVWEALSYRLKAIGAVEEPQNVDYDLLKKLGKLVGEVGGYGEED